jgi:hypothetical protein
MHRASIAFVALLALACSTVTVDECLPPCGSADQTFFARCVADGLPGVCRAGHRACCAEETGCVGALDDQTVVTTATDCMDAEEDQCWPACDESDASQYDLCLGMGSSLCAIGDEECCALEADCLGELADGDVFVWADGCCTAPEDCERGERCEPSTSLCVPMFGCGDHVTSPDEGCDDGNRVTEECPYGAMSCVVCAATCVEQPGTTRFCGDGNVDATEGETCEPPGTSACDASCQPIAPGDCFNEEQDGLETDIDCGGGVCVPCALDLGCRVASDCEPGPLECGSVPACSTSIGVCIEMNDCDDMDVCTVDACLPGKGCNSEMRDADGDRFGPESAGCGLDCDDFDPMINPSAPEVCSDGVDNDCDMAVDEC